MLLDPLMLRNQRMVFVNLLHDTAFVLDQSSLRHILMVWYACHY